jgi:hypothetical protein
MKDNNKTTILQQAAALHHVILSRTDKIVCFKVKLAPKARIGWHILRPASAIVVLVPRLDSVVNAPLVQLAKCKTFGYPSLVNEESIVVAINYYQ